MWMLQLVIPQQILNGLSSFHTVCANVGTISGHLLSGYNAGDILPNSVSCISFRPRFADVDGMAYIDAIDKWCDIYLQSGTGLNTKSVFGGTITDTRYYQNHVEDLFSVGKHLPNDNEFTVYAFGSNQGTAISGAADPCNNWWTRRYCWQKNDFCLWILKIVVVLYGNI